MKLISLIAGCTLFFTSFYTLASAGEQSTATIQVTSSVPSATFSVTPVGASDFSGVVANLMYDQATQSFSEYTLNISATFATGLTAVLASTPKMSNGTDTVDLEVSIDTDDLTNSPLTISSVTGGGSSTTSFHTLKISSPSTSTLSAGVYTGSVQIIFEDGV